MSRALFAYENVLHCFVTVEHGEAVSVDYNESSMPYLTIRTTHGSVTVSNIF